MLLFFYPDRIKSTELTCYIYEVGKCRKDLHFSVKLDEFDPSKLTLLEDELNPENYKILYDGKKFRVLKIYMVRLKQAEHFNMNI